MDAEAPLTQRQIRERAVTRLATVTNTLQKLVRKDRVEHTLGGACRPVAETVIEHMALRGIWCVKKGPASPYGMLGPRPAPQQDGGADGGDAQNG